MKLELRKIPINDICFGDETKVDNASLVLNKEEIIEELKKVPNVKDIKIDLAKPGEKTRIIPVKDVIQPRCTIKGNAGFAGVTSDVAQLGDGIVNILDGAAIVTIGDIVGFQEGVIDMWGEGAKWTPFSKTNNIVVDISVVEDLDPHEHEEACRVVGLRASEIIGLAGKEVETKDVEIFEMGENDVETKKYPDLPKVVYVEMLISQGLLHASYIYGVDSAHILPTVLHPNEELDGAVISGNCVAACDKITTYQHQNNAVIKELYKLHGKEINFLGVVLVPEKTTLDGKFVSCDYTAKLCKMLGADGVIISEEGYGNPDSDLVMICSRVEKQGIKSVLITDECSGWDGMSQPLTDVAKEAVAVVSTGNVSHVVELGKADRILGDPEAVANIAGGWAGAYNPEDGTMKCELNAVIGATSEIGTHNATVELY
ncbi:beta-aspartyl peptidase [Peptostreptococcus russellii]|uniref:Beta-aspartyl peptidase n=1 Tax=Peptostreptococcus russellii TaxID=215200 RepID=A0A2P7Q1T5_9FIRM|nr:glycine/sarcosine/betaine reductase component B subunit [Peptostreptococcus russellii]PSJ31931.1 beta-aspartyl peptidase [Peptostreptococcus russellii]